MFLFWGYPVIASLSWLRNGVMFGLLILGWALLASSLVNYVKEQFLGLGSGSRELQVWGAVLGILLSSYQTFYWRENLCAGWFLFILVTAGLRNCSKLLLAWAML